MLSKEEKEKLLTNIDRLKTDISKLRETLNDKNAEKEAIFSKKENTTKQIIDVIRDVKTLRKERDKLTNKVKSLKKEREQNNSEVLKKIEHIKKVQEESDKLVKKYNIKGDPSRLQREIEMLELKVETDVLSFQKEQKIMKEIKDMKKQLENAKGLKEVLENMNKLSKEIDDHKKQREQAHRKIQTFAAESQKKHEEMHENTKNIDKLRVNEEEIYKKFFGIKKEHTDINNELKQKLVEINNMNNKLDQDSNQVRKKSQDVQKKKLATKADEVTDKIKKRQKLTTEDLLIFQRTIRDEDEKSNPKKNYNGQKK